MRLAPLSMVAVLTLALPLACFPDDKGYTWESEPEGEDVDVTGTSGRIFTLDTSSCGATPQPRRHHQAAFFHTRPGDELLWLADAGGGGKTLASSAAC